MKRVFLLVCIAILKSNFLLAQVSEKLTIYFETGKYELTALSKESMNRTIAKVQDKKNAQFTITGYADSDGENAPNMTLSKNRALSVAQYFKVNGIENTKISINSYGEEKPIASNENEDGKQKNRRVEILLVKGEMAKDDFFSAFSKQSQFFKVSANGDIVINGAEGTTIKIPANALVKKNGEPVSGDIEIELKEFYKKSDIVLSNLHTMSDKQMLETGGMIYISAKSADEELKLKQDKKAEITMATKGNANGMQTFNGVKHGNLINWVPDGVWTGPSQNAVAIPVSNLDNSDASFQRNTEERTALNSLDQMIISSGGLGWINCDRFYSAKEKTQIVIAVDTSLKPIIRLIFNDINSVMAGYYMKKNEIIFDNIPTDQNVTVIAFAYVNDTYYFVSKKMTTSANHIDDLVLAKTNKNAIEKELKKLD